jgi:hypothetical protein
MVVAGSFKSCVLRKFGGSAGPIDFESQSERQNRADR